MQVPPRYHGFRGRFKRLKENIFFSKTNPQSLPRQTVRLQKKTKNKTQQPTRRELYCNQLRNASTYTENHTRPIITGILDI